jgi:hypothetical protein
MAPQPRIGLVLFALAAACASPKLMKSACQVDSDCDMGLLCDNNNCIDAKTKECDVVTDGNPILQPSPYTVAFGDIDTATDTQTVELHNIGNCTLTLFEADLVGGPDGGASGPFSCDFCAGKFPIEIFPGRFDSLQLGYQAKGVGRADDMLKILSDDKEFPELSVPIHANYLGSPALKAAPNPVDFGYVAMGLEGTKRVTLSNAGTGIAPVQIMSIALSPPDTMDFDLQTDAMPPLKLAPLATDSTAFIYVNLAYHPRTIAMHMAELVITTNKDELHVPLTGTSLGPPKANVAPMMLDLGMVPLGATNVLPINIQNTGGAPLIVTYAWSGMLSTDFSTAPAVLPAIAPGTLTQLQVAFTATSLNCNASGCIEKPETGLLELMTNDPEHPSFAIPVNAKAEPGPGPEVVKVEMVFDNGTDGLFDKDVRDVDMHLEHPFGYVCDKQHTPVMWGNYGNATWLAFPPKEEPERIVLSDAQIDATWRIQLTYMQDCDSLPTELLAGLLGISTDLLIDYFTGGVPIPGVGGQQVSQLISQVCLHHSSSNATVRVYVNGTLIKETTVGLAHIGDSVYAVDLVRQNGMFTAQ